jgi:hypothetical protein
VSLSLLTVVMRCVGASLLVLGLFHAVLWRTFDWGRQIAQLSPITARVFVVHMLFIVFVLSALGLLSLGWPELLLVPSELARLLLYAIALFWLLRLAFQPLVFDRAMGAGWTGSPVVRLGASLLWVSYLAVYGVALMRQFGAPR